MNIYTDIQSLPFIENVVVSVGTFDGVHTAHRTILDEVTRRAKAINGQSTIISFFAHPQKLIDPDYRIKLLTTQDEKNNLLQNCGVDNVIYLHFTQDIADMHHQDFIRFLLSKLNIRKIVVGYDHNFGKNREGNILNLQKMGIEHDFKVREIVQQKMDEQNISSSVIRKAILKGDLKTANKLLGYNYSMDVKIVSCQDNSISVMPSDSEKIIPEDGTYSIEIENKSTVLKIQNQILFVESELSFESNNNVRISFLDSENV